MAADGAVSFNLEGWVAKNGAQPYQGQLVKFGKVVRACDCSDQESQIEASKLTSQN
jgi:hypothetical protein